MSKQHTIMNLVRCTTCKTLYDGYKTKGHYTCPNCAAKIQAKRTEQARIRQRNYRNNKKKATAWGAVIGPINLRKKWIAEFGKQSLVCARCGHGIPENIVIHCKQYFSVGGPHIPENLEPMCLNCHNIEHLRNGDDGGY
jgi:hypothetical protein